MTERKAIRRKLEVLAECPINGICEMDAQHEQPAIKCGYCNDIVDDAVHGTTVVCGLDDWEG